MSMPRVSVVILNTNRKLDTLAALDSLSQQDYPDLHFIVLDNDSHDGSLEAIQVNYPQAEVMRLEHNLGYAGNNNVGIAAAMDRGSEWILVLNEDTILAPDCISQMVSIGSGDAVCGIVGPMVYHHDEPEVIQSAGGVLDRNWHAKHAGQNEVDVGQYPAPREVDWVSGCAIMVRDALVRQVGALDERFFYYFEETEWCLRARKAGWRIVHVPAARLWHKGVQRDYRPGPNVTYYATRNRFLLYLKHKAPISAWFSAWLETLRTLVSWSVRPRWRNMRSHRDALLQGAVDFLRQRWGMRSV